jgi:hypothetical protein
MKITALVPRFQADPRFPTVVGVRKGAAVDEFTAAVGKAAGVEIPVLEGSSADVPRDGYLLLFEPVDLSAFGQVAKRSILVDADRSYVTDELERYELLGAVDKHRYYQWRGERQKESGRGLWGRKEVAVAIGAELSSGPFTTARYGLFIAAQFPDLPSLIVGYLSAVDGLQDF